MRNLDSILKSRDITLVTKVCLVSSVQFSRSVVTDSLQPHEPQHARLPCPSPTPGLHPNPCPSGRWCHPAISSSVVLFSIFHALIFPSIRVFSNESPHCMRWPKYWSFSFNIFPSCPQSFPALGSFPMSHLIAWGGQSIGVSASTSVLPMNTQNRSPLEWTGWMSLQSKGLSRVFSNTTVQKHQFFAALLSL